MTDSPVAGFISCLDAERAALQTFISTLEAEQQALIHGDAERLLALAEGKNQEVLELNRLAQERKNFLLAGGAEIGNGGVIAWLKANAPGSLPVWQDIQQLVERLQYLNRINGTLIQTKLRHNQQALTVLHNAANSTHGLYGADGQPRPPSSGRILGSV